MECKFWLGTDIRGRFRLDGNDLDQALIVPTYRLQGAITDLRMLLQEVEDAHHRLNAMPAPSADSEVYLRG